MERIAVGVRIDRDRLDAHTPGGLDDPTSNLAAIGNQDALEHCGNFVSELAPCLCGVVVKMSNAVSQALAPCRPDASAASPP